MMTKKHFKKLVNIVANLDEARRKQTKTDPITYLIDELCYWLEDENPQFNESKFRQAISEEITKRVIKE